MHLFIYSALFIGLTSPILNAETMKSTQTSLETNKKTRDKRQAKALKKKASCTTFAEVTSKVYSSPAGKAALAALQKAAPHGTAAATVIQSMDAGIKAWNSMANNSSATIGPRKLEFIPSGQTGKLVGLTERVFVSPVPLAGKVELDFYRTGGKGWAKIGICTVPPGKSKAKHIKTFLIEEDTKKGKFKSVVLKGNWDPGALLYNPSGYTGVTPIGIVLGESRTREI